MVLSGCADAGWTELPVEGFATALGNAAERTRLGRCPREASASSRWDKVKPDKVVMVDEDFHGKNVDDSFARWIQFENFQTLPLKPWEARTNPVIMFYSEASPISEPKEECTHLR